MTTHGISPLVDPVGSDSTDHAVPPSNAPQQATPPRFVLLRVGVARFLAILLGAMLDPVEILAQKQFACRSIQYNSGIELGVDPSVSCQDNPQIERLLAQWGTFSWVINLVLAGIVYPFWTINISRLGRRRVMLLGFFTTAIEIGVQAYLIYLSRWSSLTDSAWRDTDVGLILWRASVCCSLVGSIAGGTQNVGTTASIATMSVFPEQDRANKLNILDAIATTAAVLGALLTSVLPAPRSVTDSAHLDTVGPIAWIVGASLSSAGFLYVLLFVPTASLEPFPESSQNPKASVETPPPHRNHSQSMVTDCEGGVKSESNHWASDYKERLKYVCTHRPAHPANSPHRPLGSFPVPRILLCTLFAVDAGSGQRFKVLLADYKFHWGAKEVSERCSSRSPLDLGASQPINVLD